MTTITHTQVLTGSDRHRLYHFRREATSKIVEEVRGIPGVETSLKHMRYSIWITKANQYDWPEVERDLVPVLEAFEEGLFGAGKDA